MRPLARRLGRTSQHVQTSTKCLKHLDRRCVPGHINVRLPNNARAAASAAIRVSHNPPRDVCHSNTPRTFPTNYQRQPFQMFTSPNHKRVNPGALRGAGGDRGAVGEEVRPHRAQEGALGPRRCSILLFILRDNILYDHTMVYHMMLCSHISRIYDTAGRGSRLPQLYRGSNPPQSSMKSIDSTTTSAGQFASPGGNLPSEILVRTHLPAGAATP